MKNVLKTLPCIIFVFLFLVGCSTGSYRQNTQEPVSTIPVIEDEAQPEEEILSSIISEVFSIPFEETGYQGKTRASYTNPSFEEIKSAMITIGKKYDIPPEILWAIGWGESKFVQFKKDGTPLVSFDNGIGIMQVTPWAISVKVDEERLKYDYLYNIECGAKVILVKWKYKNSNTIPTIGSGDPLILESWYFALWAYNGWSYLNNPNVVPIFVPVSSLANGGYWKYKAAQDIYYDYARDIFEITITKIPKSSLPQSGLPSGSTNFLLPVPWHYSIIHEDNDDPVDPDPVDPVDPVDPDSNPDFTNPGYESPLNPFTAYYKGSSMWYAFGRAYEVTAKTITFSSSYNRWPENWIDGDTDGTGKILELSRGTTPKKKSIVIFSIGDNGFAAFVEAVSDSTITISLSDINGNGEYNGTRVINTDDSNITGYIYLEEIPEPPTPVEFILDNDDNGFYRNGTGWYSASIGYEDNMMYSYANSGCAGMWQLSVPEEGEYELFVFIPRNNATSTKAPYSIFHKTGRSTIYINQNAYYDAWVSLGTYTLSPDSSDFYRRIFLNTATGEQNSIKLGFDAVKIVKK